MGRWVLLWACCAALVAAGCDAGGKHKRDGGGGDAGDGGPVDTRDTDGDGISDSDEGRAGNTDTDGDGTPDYQDDDSDGDGIPDSQEAGDDDVRTPPRDCDGDGVPDFQDEDSDDNTIPDSEEELGDTDGDGTPDYCDLDDDNDRVEDRREIDAAGGDPNTDTDADGLPNYKDPDSDNDTISDGDERDLDTDGDGLQDWYDTDSDDDGIPDADEAGDADLSTPPVDTDEDGTPDFRDADSDNDGISDSDELDAGTDPTDGDSDGDGVSDLIEVGAGTDPLDPEDNPRERGDFVFVVPYEEPPDPERDTLEFRTDIQFADVYFLFDKTGSMDAEIAAMTDAAEGVIDNLTCEDFGTACEEDTDCGDGQACGFEGTCIEDPSTTTCVPSLWTGTGDYTDELSYRNRVSLQPDPSTTVAGFPCDDCAGGGSESLYESVACVADPTFCMDWAGCTGPIGCPSYREEAVRILVTITDEGNDCGSSCSPDTVGPVASRLTSAGITFVGLYAKDPPDFEYDEVEPIAIESDSLDSSGDPLMFVGEDTAVVPALTDAINEIVEGVPLRVTIDATDEPGDAGDSLQFIDYLEISTDGEACTDVTPTEDTDGDGFDDAFPELTPGTPVCWDVVPKMNTTVMPSGSPQVFRAKLTVYGDGSPLDSRIVFFLVPPVIEMPDGPD